MIYLYDKEGKKVQVNESQVGDALASGNYFPPKEGLNLTTPEGELVGVDAPHILKALQQGYTPESQEAGQERRARSDLGALAQPAAAAAGAVRGATLGFSDVVMTEVGAVSPSDLRQLKEGFPATSVASEITGAVGGALFTKKLPTPAAGATKLGRITSDAIGARVLASLSKNATAGAGKQMLAKAVGRTASGAVEGALFGAGGAVSETALGQAEDLGEALVAHVGPALLLGGIIGGGTSIASDVAGAAFKKTASVLGKGKAAIGPELTQSATFNALKTVTGKPDRWVRKYMSKLDDESLVRMERSLFEEGALPNAQGIFEPLLQKGLNAKQLADRTMAAGKYWGKTLGVLREAAEEAGAKIDGAALGAAVGEAVRTAAPRSIIGKAAKKAHTRFTRDLPREWASLGEINPVDLQAIKYQVDDMLYTAARKRDTTLAAMLKPARAEISKAQDDVMRAALDGDQYVAYSQAMKMYRVLGDLANAAKDTQGAGGAKNAFERMAGYAVRSGGWRVMGGAGLAAVGKAVAVGGAMFGAARAAAGFGGAAGPALIRRQLGSMMTLQKAAQRTESSIEAAAKSFLKGGSKAVIPASSTILNKMTGSRDSKSGYKKARDRLSQWRAKGEDTAAILAANMSYMNEAAPNSSSAATMTVGRILQGLDLPGSRPMSLQPALDMKDDPAVADVRKFAAKLAGAFDPLGTIRDAGNLNLSYVQAQAFQKAYPKLHAKLSLAIREKVSTYSKRLSYAQLFQLSILVGEPLTPQLQGSQIARAQSAFAPIQAQQVAPPAKSPKGLDKLGEGREGMAGRMEKAV